MDSPQHQTRHQTLTRHIQRLERHIDTLLAADRRFFWLRLGVLVGGALLVFLSYLTGQGRLVWVALALSVLAFSAVVFFHRRLDRSILRTRLSRQYYRAQAARMDLDWESIPFHFSDIPGSAVDGAADSPLAAHPFAADLNIVGDRSIHQLVDTAFSLGGSRRVRDWLLSPVPVPGTIAERQAILAELGPLAGFRSRLTLNSALVQAKPGERWDGEALLRWLREESGGKSLAPVLVVLAGLAALSAAFFLLNLFAGLPPFWILSFMLYVAIYYSRYRDLEETFEDAQRLGVELEKFRAVAVYLEQYPFSRGSRLAEICAPFKNSRVRPSHILRRVTWIASAASLRGNPFVWAVINAVLPWDLYFTHRLRQLREAIHELLPTWLDAWYELEALSSLANFAYLNPSFVVPEVKRLFSWPDGRSEDAAFTVEPVFAARRVGHPLLPKAEKVSNDFTILRLGEVFIITGSNMSGKSTFLRTIGVNLALAFAGGPVDAESLVTLPFRLFTCISVSDSLSDGISYFYAEVRRLKSLLDELNQSGLQPPVGSLPLFFLIDEIFRGTNNRERQIGSRAYVQSLVGAYGVGVISTHDLELAHLADELPGVSNQHFREDVQGQRMVFDYRLRPGPSPTTNALKIMQLEGLPVDSTVEK
jgi:hypothetical protein